MQEEKEHRDYQWIKKKKSGSDLVAGTQAYHPSTWKADAGGASVRDVLHETLSQTP